MKVYDHVFDKHEKKEFDSIYKFKPGAYLKLMKLENGYLNKVGEDDIYLGDSSDTNLFKFSNDHKQFALFNH